MRTRFSGKAPKFLCILALFPLACPALATASSRLTPNVAEQYLLSAANHERATRGLTQLHLDATLTQAALCHARQMADHADISHRFPGEPELSERGANAGVHFTLIAENVAEAPDAAVIHDLWMHSEGHRANLLDPDIDAVGISVIQRGHQFYAVEDFASTVESLSFTEQESTVASLLAQSGVEIAGTSGISIEDARRTCSMTTGYAGHRQPWYIMRYTAGRLTELPSALQSRLNSGKYRQAVVGACTSPDQGPFTAYNIAVLLY